MAHRKSDTPATTRTKKPIEVTRCERAERLFMSGKPDKAIKELEVALAANPTHLHSLRLMAGTIASRGDHLAALPYRERAYNIVCERANQIEPDEIVDTTAELAWCCLYLKRVEAAHGLFKSVLHVNANHVNSRIGIANALVAIGCGHALGKGTDDPHLPVATKDADHLHEAAEFFERALWYNHRDSQAHYNLGNVWTQLGRPDKGLICMELAIEYNPCNVDALNNLAVMYGDLQNTTRAIELYERAVNAFPKTVDQAPVSILGNLGCAYRTIGDHVRARRYLEKAIERDPLAWEARSHLVSLEADEGDLAAAARNLAMITTERDNRELNCKRLMFSTYSMSMHESFELHRRWGCDFVKTLGISDSDSRTRTRYHHDHHKCINVAYFTDDVREHSVMFFIEALLRYHDRQLFKIFVYTNAVNADATTHRVRTTYEFEWRIIHRVNVADVLEMMDDDEIDVAVDLSGHTGTRMDVFAFRPAAVQITYLGYPGTTGLPQMRYRFTDAITDPADTTQEYTETLVRLPNGFLCFTPGPLAPEIVENPPCVQRGHVTFGSLNALHKINNDVVALWSRVLGAVPTSRLILKAKGLEIAAVQERLIGQFERRGISRKRITFMTRKRSVVEHLETYSEHLDIALDTFPYTGVTTSCQSLWMGVPVITLSGKDCHMHNVGVSILTHAGLAGEGLIARDTDEFVTLATALANDTEKISRLRSTLRERMTQSSLCNGQQFTRDVETVYTDLWHDALDRNTTSPGEADKSD